MSFADTRREISPSAGDVAPADEPPLGGGDRASRAQPARSRVRAVGPQISIAPEAVVRRALRLACANRGDFVAVAGPDGLSAMISLCRDGFERVECARQTTCAGADEACDLLLIVGAMDAAALTGTVERTVRLLRDDAVLVAQASGAEERAAIRFALATAGFESGFSVAERAVGGLVLHRVRRRAAARKAA